MKTDTSPIAIISIYRSHDLFLPFAIPPLKGDKKVKSKHNTINRVLTTQSRKG